MFLLQLVKEMTVIDRLPRPIHRIRFILISKHDLSLPLFLQITQLHVLKGVLNLYTDSLLGHHLQI